MTSSQTSSSRNNDATSVLPMIPVPQALSIVLEQVLQRKPTQPITTREFSVGQVLAAPVLVPPPGYPAYRASIMDGYAVCSSKSTNRRKIVGRVLAGGQLHHPDHRNDDNTAVYITTGAPVPEHYDCVVPVEECDVIEDQLVTDAATIAPLRWVRPVGCDMAPNEILLPKGHVLDAISIALLAQVQCREIQVMPTPTVGILSTGNELLGQDQQEEKLGCIPDANRPLLIHTIRDEFKCPTNVMDLGIIGDEPDALEICLRQAVDRCDVVVTTGGISRGDADYLQEILVHRMKGTMYFGRMHMKPGKPTTFVTFPKSLVLCLPGNPVSAAVCAQLLLKPALDLWTNPNCNNMQDALVHPELEVTLTHDISLDIERPEYHRVRLDWSNSGKYALATSTGVQRSSRLMSMRGAHALLVLPQGSKNRPKVLQDDTIPALLLSSASSLFNGVPLYKSNHLSNIGKRHCHVGIVQVDCEESGLDERVRNALSGSRSGGISVVFNRHFQGDTLYLFDFLLQEPTDVVIVVVPCLGDNVYRRSLSISQTVRTHLEKPAEALSQEARKGSASQDPRSALFETTVGYAKGTVIVCLPLEGVDGGLAHIRGLLKHAMEIGRGNILTHNIEIKE